MVIIPAIDLLDGRVVRLKRGERAASTIYRGTPEGFARKFARAGARFIHVVDLEGAFEGKPVHLSEIRRILAASGIPCEVGGGIRTERAIRAYLGAGANRVVLGTRAADEPAWAGRMCRKFPGRIAVGVDLKGGRLATKGWVEASGPGADAAIRAADRLGARVLIATDVSRDGMLSGPNLPLLRRALRILKTPLVASGGVSSLADIRLLSRLPLEGAIVGRAIYEGAVDLAAAIRAAGVGFPRG
ncbi:MAG: HisA/HisF-related TIM barrel protein [Planctomycetota bacterium]